MNIIEATKTGKRIRRKGLGGWMSSPWPGAYVGSDDILADDWEVEETPITLTRTQFDAAYSRTLKTWEPLSMVEEIRKVLAKELGFGGDE